MIGSGADSWLSTSWSNVGWILLSGPFAVQWVIAQFRRRSFGSRVVDNEPLLLVRDGQFIDGALTAARVTRSDVHAKLRQANIHRMDEVVAVVLETTGDVSVLHGDAPLDPELFDDVRHVGPEGPLPPGQP